MCAAYFLSVHNAPQTPTTRQGRMLLENLPAAHMKRIRTDSNLRVKLHKTKRKLAESPAIDIANTFEWLRIAPPSRRWLHHTRPHAPLAAAA